MTGGAPEVWTGEPGIEPATLARLLKAIEAVLTIDDGRTTEHARMERIAIVRVGVRILADRITSDSPADAGTDWVSWQADQLRQIAEELAAGKSLTTSPAREAGA